MFLQIQGIQKSFGAGDSRVDVLKGLDLDIERGEFCVLLGPSGSGKSTLLNIIGGIDSADEGNLVIDGERLADMSEKKLSLYRRKHLGYIFQMYNLIPNLTVRENIEVGAYLSDKPLDVDELLHTLGIYEHQRKLPNQLSGGQQQRTAIGRAIVKNPDILLCDEPTGALDYNTSKEILKLIETVNHKYGNTIVMVTHNDAIKDMADRVVKLRDGMIRRNYQNEQKIPAADLPKAGSEASADVHKVPVSPAVHPHPAVCHLNKHQLQYSPSQSDWESDYTSEKYIPDVFCGRGKASFHSYPPAVLPEW